MPRRLHLHASLALMAIAVLAAPNLWATPLDTYVNAPDPSYQWSLAGQIEQDGLKAFNLDLVSQNWRTTEDVDRTEWRHWLTIIVPEGIQHGTAMLFIGGGGNGGPAPDKLDPMLAQFAMLTKSVVAELKQVPNQPLVFGNDGKPRKEDDLIAYTWDKYLRTGDVTWPARLPMTKSAVRAMDAVQEFMLEQQATVINGFVVAGGSKRGWTTWTTGAVDKRVRAIAPIVIDVANVEPSMKHHYQAYGFWAPSVGDYVAINLMQWMDTPQFDDLMDIVDPYRYRHRYTMPKFVLNAAGDQFFLPDSSQFYYHELPGEKILRYVPNTDHGLGRSDAPESLLAWYFAILNGVPRPDYAWTKSIQNNTATLTATSKTTPKEALLWTATNPDARDFRLETLGPVWTSQPLEWRADGSCEAQVNAPEKGWTACFIELAFDVGAPMPLKVTTEVAVVPDIRPGEGVFGNEVGPIPPKKEK